MLSQPMSSPQPQTNYVMSAELAGVELSIVMPCLNEAKTLETCIRKAQLFLNNSGIVGEIIVADNGSSDGSQAIAQRLGVRVIRVAERGYGAALAAGIAAAQGRYIIMGDSDDSYDFTALMPFVVQLREGFDVVIGNRFTGGIQSRAMPFLHKHLGNPILSMIGRLFFKSSCRDFYCGLRGFKKMSIRQLNLRSTGMEFALEMIVRATMLGMRVTEVPTTLSPDGRGGRSHLRTWRDGWRSLRFFLLYSPRWLFLYPGVVLVVLGAFFGFWLAFGPGLIGPIVSEIHTMLFCATAVILGFQAVIFSFLSKILTINAGFHPRNAKVEKWLRAIPLETGLAAGIVLVVLSVGLSVYGVRMWRRPAFGALDPFTEMHLIIPALLGLLLGSQTIFSSFYLCLLQLQNQRFCRQDQQSPSCISNAATSHTLARESVQYTDAEDEFLV